MTTLEYAPYNSDDNIVQLTSDQQSDYSTRSETLQNMNAVIGLVEFTCPTTLVQLWDEIDNLEVNDKKVKLAQIGALKYMMAAKYDTLLHIYSNYQSGTDSNKLSGVDRIGDLVLGVTCERAGPVEIHVGGVHKFTKECNTGFNAFSRDEVVPMIALCYHTISTKGQYITDIVYGTILHADLRKQLVDFYSSPNPSMYVVQNGLDIGVT